MRFSALLVKLSLAAMLAVASSTAVFAQDAEMVRRFDYEARHALNAEARRDRIAFVTEQLTLKPLPAQVIDTIPDLYQPPRQN